MTVLADNLNSVSVDHKPLVLADFVAFLGCWHTSCNIFQIGVEKISVDNISGCGKLDMELVMAIFISKTNIGAQSKGAMTNLPLANSTFTESPFYLRDTMKKEGCFKNAVTYSRRKARKLIKEQYPNLPRNIIIHHKDFNPLNNDPQNLELMLNAKHISYHACKSSEWGGKKKLTIEILEKLLIIYNKNL